MDRIYGVGSMGWGWDEKVGMGWIRWDGQDETNRMDVIYGVRWAWDGWGEMDGMG